MKSEPTRRCANGRGSDTRDIAIKLGGAAMIAGFVSGKPKLRKYLAVSGLLLIASAMAPDLVRYIKIESM